MLLFSKYYRPIPNKIIKIIKVHLIKNLTLKELCVGKSKKRIILT